MDTDGLGPALARQIGNGLNNLHTLFLTHQQSSERWRTALDSKIDSKFEAMEKKLIEVCDKGGQEHREFDDRITRMEQRFAIAGAVSTMLSWLIEHGWKVALVLYFIWDSAEPYLRQSIGLRGTL